MYECKYECAEDKEDRNMLRDCIYIVDFCIGVDGDVNVVVGGDSRRIPFGHRAIHIGEIVLVGE